MSIQAWESKLVITSFAHTRYSICLPKPLIFVFIACYLSSKAIAFVVDFSVQYYVYL
jgi:hypothetical protein